MAATALAPITLTLPTEARTGTVALLVPVTHPIARTLEAAEANVFPEAPTLFDLPDADDLFAFLVISVDGEARDVVRLSAPVMAGRHDLLPYFVTNLVESDPDLSAEDVTAYYQERGVDVRSLLGVETHFRLGDHLEPVRASDLAYLSLFKLALDHSSDGVIAHINGPSIGSFKRIGLTWRPFAGQVDLRTPTVKEDGSVGFDDDYFPVFVPVADNRELLTGLGAFTPPMYSL